MESATRARPASQKPVRGPNQGRKKPLAGSFYARSTIQVAVDLLGKLLVVRDEKTGVESGGIIVETEAYAGTDPASHSRNGITPRSAPMFEKPGHAYVYFTYGMYEMLNFVTEPAGHAGAVLIRGIAPTLGLETIARRRKGVPEKNWTNGPGRLCKALGIRMADNREPLQGPRLFVYEAEKPGRHEISREKHATKASETSPAIHSSPRVGITQATELHWRFFYTGHPHVSPVKENKVSRAHRSSPARTRKGAR